MPRPTVQAMLLGVCVLLSSPIASAVADIPAPWRGQDGSVYGYWEFIGPDNPYLPDEFASHRYPGTQLYNLSPTVEMTNMVWYDDGSVNGWIGLPGTSIININFPNIIDDLPLKNVWVQIFYTPLTQDPWYPFVAAIEASEQGQQVLGDLTGYYDAPGYRLETWEIRPNPDFELIQIYVPSLVLVDKIIVDTISTVPEASTFAMMSVVGLAVGGVVVARRRRVTA